MTYYFSTNRENSGHHNLPTDWNTKNIFFPFVPNGNCIICRCPNNDYYRKNRKHWDTLNYYSDCPTNGIVGFYSAILRSKDADRITNRVDTDQTALRSSLIWVCTVCLDLSVPIFQIITVLHIIVLGTKKRDSLFLKKRGSHIYSSRRRDTVLLSVEVICL